ncbi:hypothetical protein CRG98_041136, partial [Punica granatum]
MGHDGYQLDFSKAGFMPPTGIFVGRTYVLVYSETRITSQSDVSDRCVSKLKSACGKHGFRRNERVTPCFIFHDGEILRYRRIDPLRRHRRSAFYYSPQFTLAVTLRHSAALGLFLLRRSATLLLFLDTYDSIGSSPLPAEPPISDRRVQSLTPRSPPPTPSPALGDRFRHIE